MADDASSSGGAAFVEPIKRASQACENCRRKKSRCPGQQPRCSLCVHLRQRCIYVEKRRRPERRGRERSSHARAGLTPVQEQNESSRLSAVESKLDDLAQALRAKGIVNFTDEEGLRDGTELSVADLDPAPNVFHITNEYSIPDKIRVEGIALYFEHFHNQPYPLLMAAGDTSQALAVEYPKLVLLPLLAVSLCTCQNPYFQSEDALAQTRKLLSEAAWTLLVARYAESDFDLSYFQALCLLAQVDFATGKPDRAQRQIALGLRIAQTRGLLDKEGAASAEHRLSLGWRAVIWTMYMMDRVFSGTSGRACCVPASFFQLFLVQGAPVDLEGTPGREELTLTPRPGEMLGAEPLDLVSCNIILLDIWHSAVLDATFSEDSPASAPFWRNDSVQATIESRLLEFEMKAYSHRYNVVGSPRRVLDEPHLRPYFSAWVFPQMLYSAIRCYIYHPFILFMKTRQQHGQVPLTTLQRSYNDAIIHSSWILRHMVEMEEAGISLQDPFFSFLIALAASIQLEHTTSDNVEVATAARSKYDKAHAHLQKSASLWPNVENMLGVLEELSVRLHHRRCIKHVQSEYNGAIPSKNPSHMNVEPEDMNLMLKLLDYASLSKVQNKLRPLTISATPRHREGSNKVPSVVPEHSMSDDLEAIETRHPRSDPMSVLEELGWPSGSFQAFPETTNGLSFFGQPWSTYSSEGTIYTNQNFSSNN